MSDSRGECADLATSHSGALWASERRFAGNAEVVGRIRRLRRELLREFGWRSRVSAALMGPFLLATLLLEERRLRRGWTYEPGTFFEINPAAAALGDPRWRTASPCRWVSLEGDEPPTDRGADATGLAPGVVPAG